MVQLPRWQRILILAILVVGGLYALPNFLPKSTLEELPDWVPAEQVNLGLDLRGGSYMLLEVDLKSLDEDQLKDLAAKVNFALREAKLGFSNLGVRDGVVAFTLRDTSKVAEATGVLKEALGNDVAITDLGGGGFSLGYDEKFLADYHDRVVNRAVEVLHLRIDPSGTKEPTIQRQGEVRILVQLPGEAIDPEVIKQTAKMTFRMVLEKVRPGVDPIPAGASILETKPDEKGQAQKLAVEDRVMVSGEDLTDAQLAFDQGAPVVSFRFNASGGKAFCDATRDNVGRFFAIVLDKTVISYPRIKDAICGGAGIITGSFTQQEASQLALLLRSGALPAPLTIIEERTVGPGLGADSVEAGEIAAIAGVVLVVVFMGAMYGLFGVFANVALLANLGLLLGALTAMQATLTLPGIAGIALTMGMAVDANVLIFERMREEARNGRNPTLAVDSGYRRAMTTILDSNLTTLIAALLLYQFGTGPVKGFAVTLSIGIITSMFTAIMLTRWMVVAWLRRKKRAALPI